ncbi:MAG: low molecular weight phosphotyrosine protein phosphatase [Bacteroidetes bacterium]|nr:low molecular weight phosphotyrosine protein phosphatase [Bacteroidota bacterium]
MKKILFVCLGNICRSPVAEGIFLHQVKLGNLNHQFSADSAGTAGYHIGERPHSTSTSVARSYGIVLDHHGRQFSREDFNRYDMIICMDHSNLANVRREAVTPEEKSKIFLMRQWEKGSNPEDRDHAQDVPDPYYGGTDGFHLVHQLLETCNKNLIAWLSEKR